LQPATIAIREAGKYSHDTSIRGTHAVEREAAQEWFAVYTSSNHEKKAAQQLMLREIETFLPTHRVTRRWRNRVTAKLEMPLFAGYLFVKVARSQCASVLSVPLVHSIVGNGREAIALPDQELELLRLGLQQRQVDPYPYLKVGEMARIRSGALAGLQGIIIRKDDQLRVVLSIDLIMKSIAVHVTADELEACS
jgi:transcription antitermination factor NusG